MWSIHKNCIFLHGVVSKWSQRAWLEIKLSARARGFESHPLRQEVLEAQCFKDFYFSRRFLNSHRQQQNGAHGALFVVPKHWIPFGENECCGAQMVPRGAVETYKTSEYHMQNSYSFWGLPRIIRKRIRRYDNRDFRLCLYDFICIINVAWLNAKVMEMVTTVSFEITTYDYASPDSVSYTHLTLPTILLV